MKRWESTLYYCVVVFIWPGKYASPGKTIPEMNVMHNYTKEQAYMDSSNKILRITKGLQRSLPKLAHDGPKLIPSPLTDVSNSSISSFEFGITEFTSDPPDLPPVLYAALPRGLAVTPLPLKNSDHEIMLNVTWDPPMGPPVSSYSLEVDSIRNSVDCRSTLCYEYDIPGDALWSLVPSVVSPMAGGCAVRPGCPYRVKLIAHPWDGHTSANMHVQLDECVSGVCSCAHLPRLPKPEVTAEMLSVMGDLFVNVTWFLPAPEEPLRLPPRLRKRYYYVSLGKQMISNAHPSPWYSNTITRSKEADGFVAVPEGPWWMVLPVNERSVGRNDHAERKLVLDVKLLARVSLVDERGCIGPAGNFTAYDPLEKKAASITNYLLWALLGGVTVFGMGLILACSTHAIKRILREFRPVRVPSPLQSMNNRPIWFLRHLTRDHACWKALETSR